MFIKKNHQGICNDITLYFILAGGVPNHHQMQGLWKSKDLQFLVGSSSTLDSCIVRIDHFAGKQGGLVLKVVDNEEERPVSIKQGS